VLAEALATAHKNGERHWEAELYRLRGELLQKAKGKGRKAKTESAAEECFRQAIEIARRQGAKSLELRAVMSLGHLLQKQGKKEEARQMLVEVYGWFTEGFDAQDLKDATMLLQELEERGQEEQRTPEGLRLGSVKETRKEAKGRIG